MCPDTTPQKYNRIQAIFKSNRILGFLLILLILLITCQSQEKTKKRDLIPRDKLVPALVDMHLLYSIQTSTDFIELTRKMDSIDPYSYIFQKHKITKASFDSTISYYSQYPEELTYIYDEVIMQLTRKRDSINLH